ncbi:MAG TPA: hypothetical protein VF765_25295 [Polyangiaceae bacterium]
MQAQHTNRPSRVAAGVAWGMGALLALPIVVLRYPPMGDLPMHEALVSLMRHMGDAAWEPAGVYRLNLGPPNQLFHWLAWALSFALPTDLACKIVVAAAVVATPAAALRLARYVGTTPWAALLVAPLALGFAFRWGLVGNVLAPAVLLSSLPTLDALATAPTARRAAEAAGVTVLAYVAHESALMALAIAAGVLAVWRGSTLARDKGTLVMLRLAPLATAAALAVFFWALDRRIKTPAILAVADTFGAGPIQRLADAPRVLLGPTEPVASYGAFAMYALAVAAFTVVGWRARAAEPADPMRRRFVVIGALWAALYLAMPLAFSGATLLYQRFLPMAFALLVVVLAPPASATMRPLLPLLAAATSIASLFLVLPRFGSADRDFRDLDAVLAQIAPCSAIAQLDLTPRAPGPVAPVPGAAARALAVRGGRLLFSFTDASISPVVVRRAHQWNEPVLRIVRDPTEFRPAHDFRRFRYALVRLAPEYVALSPVIAAIMAPEGKLAAQSGEWLLFESTLPVDPIESPDEPLPVPPQESLRERLSALQAHASPQPQ